MNFIEVVKRLKDGEAAKVSTWLGYLERVNTVQVKAFATDGVFVHGDVVKYAGKIYQRTGPDGDPPYDAPSKDASWSELCDIPHKLILRSRSGDTDYYTSQADVTKKKVVYGDWGYQEYTTAQTPGLFLDGELFTAIVSSDWEIAPVSVYAASRGQGSSGKW